MPDRASQPRRRAAVLTTAAAMSHYVAAAAGLLLLLVFFAAPERIWWTLAVGGALVLVAVARSLWAWEVFMLVWIGECLVAFAVPAVIVWTLGFSVWTWAAMIVFGVLFTGVIFTVNARFAEADADTEPGGDRGAELPDGAVADDRG